MSSLPMIHSRVGDAPPALSWLQPNPITAHDVAVGQYETALKRWHEKHGDALRINRVRSVIAACEDALRALGKKADPAKTGDFLRATIERLSKPLAAAEAVHFADLDGPALAHLLEAADEAAFRRMSAETAASVAAPADVVAARNVLAVAEAEERAAWKPIHALLDSAKVPGSLPDVDAFDRARSAVEAVRSLIKAGEPARARALHTALEIGAHTPAGSLEARLWVCWGTDHPAFELMRKRSAEASDAPVVAARPKRSHENPVFAALIDAGAIPATFKGHAGEIFHAAIDTIGGIHAVAKAIAYEGNPSDVTNLGAAFSRAVREAGGPIVMNPGSAAFASVG